MVVAQLQDWHSTASPTPVTRTLQLTTISVPLGGEKWLRDQ